MPTQFPTSTSQYGVQHPVSLAHCTMWVSGAVQ
jgi:hypothetical protein